MYVCGAIYIANVSVRYERNIRETNEATTTRTLVEISRADGKLR